MQTAAAARNSEVILNLQKRIQEKGAEKTTQAFVSELRREIPLVSQRNQYEFSVHQGVATNISPTERVISDNDEFVITEIGFFLLRKYTPSAGTFAGITRQDHNLDTYANSQFYGVNYPEFENLYKGKLTYSVENRQHISAYNLAHNLVKRVGKADGGFTKVYDEQDGSIDGFSLTANNYHLKGWQRTKWEANFPNISGATFAIPNKSINSTVHTGQAFFVLILRGVLISNARAIY